MIIAEPTAAQAADVIAINHLAASYAEAVSRLQIEEAVETYAVDGVLASPTTDDAVGRAAIVSVISAATESLEFVFQTVQCGLVRSSTPAPTNDSSASPQAKSSSTVVASSPWSTILVTSSRWCCQSSSAASVS